MKTCTVCKEEKPLDQYYKYKSSKDGKQYRCKVCDDKAGRAYRTKHKDVLKVARQKDNLKQRYGMTLEEYDEMFNTQGKMCKICSKTGQDVRFVVDHCHTTGKVRGILCNSCNRGLGYFGDSPEALKIAITYLTEVH